MELVYIVVGLALLQFWVFGLIVGGQRVKLKVDAPATTGNPIFERYHRVHYNTMEQLIIFIPSIFIYAHIISTTWAAGLGIVYLIGRIVFWLFRKASARSSSCMDNSIQPPDSIIAGLIHWVLAESHPCSCSIRVFPGVAVCSRAATTSSLPNS